ncbi:MAG TPA: branched-chain amino acid ABC transporter permease [Solirubrobacteraceae bacterium]
MRFSWRLALAGLGLAYLVWRGLTADLYGLDILMVAVVFGMYASAVDLAWGYAGILLLGSALFFGIGAYGAGFALDRGWEPLLVYPLAMACASLLAVVIGFVGFRRGASQVHFGLIGLALSLVFERIAVSEADITGGSNGLIGLPRPVLAGVVDLSNSVDLYTAVVVVVVVVVVALYLLQASAWGDAVRAVRMDERKAASLGYDVLAIKLQVIGLVAAVIALAGALFTSVNGTAYPALFGIVVNMQALVWVALGGAGTLLGPLLVATALKLTESYLSDAALDYYQLLLGLAFVVVVVALPAGLGGVPRIARKHAALLLDRRARKADPARLGGRR